jgi:class 3 adenylate cyclase
MLWFATGHALRALVLLAAVTLLSLEIATVLLHQGLHLPTAGILLSAMLALSARTIAETVKQLLVKRRMRNVFSGYVSPQIMAKILGGNLDAGLTSQNRKICLLFSDIRGFTTLGEGMEPEKVIALLNRYFEEMTTAVHDNQGTIDKFMADGIMAFFGAPADLGNPVSAAMTTAKEMLARLRTLNRSLQAEGGAALAIGIGLHLGEAVVGHVGSRTRREYTAIGDAVKLTARFEGLTKELGYPLLCTDAV